MIALSRGDWECQVISPVDRRLDKPMTNGIRVAIREDYGIDSGG